MQRVFHSVAKYGYYFDRMKEENSIALIVRVMSAGVVAAVLAMTASTGRAALGEAEGSIAADAVGARAAVEMSPQAGFTVNRFTDATATNVREYAAPNGIVFAVAWDGMATPDLSRLLGAYYGDYVSAAAGAPAGSQRSRGVGQGGIVERSGPMRAMRGRAYVPALMPAGVDESEIK